MENEHNYESATSEKPQKYFRNACKRKAVDNYCNRTEKIICTALASMPVGYLQYNDMTGMTQAMYEQRKKLFP